MDVTGAGVSVTRSGAPPAERGTRTSRLLLVRHAPTAATRRSAFPADDPLDDRGREAASKLGSLLPRRIEVLSSPARRCVQTADAAGLSTRIDGGLGECDFGSWAGKTLADVHAQDPAGVLQWMREPTAAPHGGEDLASLVERVAGWLESRHDYESVTVAITHAEVIKAAVVHVLGAPLQSFWRIDVDPLSITELHARERRWTLVRANCRHRGSP